MENSEKIIEQEVRKFWKNNGYNVDVVCFFKQAYENDTFEYCDVIVECDNDSENSDTVGIEFSWDFCEGQTRVKDLHIIELYKVLDYYSVYHNYVEREVI